MDYDVWEMWMHTPATAGEMDSSSADDDLDLNVFDPYTQAALIRGKII